MRVSSLVVPGSRPPRAAPDSAWRDAALVVFGGPDSRTLAAVQGKPADIGGYYLPDLAKLDAVMRPSKTLNAALAAATA